MNQLPRILLVADLSERTREALDDVTHMHRRWGTFVDAYYVWSNATDVPEDSPERTMLELEAFSRYDGAWDALDELSALDRAGVLSIRGYLTPSETGSTLVEHASERGYLGILHGTRDTADPSLRFDIHGRPPPCAPLVPVRSIVSIAIPRRAARRANDEVEPRLALTGTSPRPGRTRLLAR